jgi:hypothetical protein
MTKAAKALSRVIVSRKTRAPLTLTVKDNARGMLDAYSGLLAAEAAHRAAILGILVGLKRRQPADEAFAAAREAYRLHAAKWQAAERGLPFDPAQTFMWRDG